MRIHQALSDYIKPTFRMVVRVCHCIIDAWRHSASLLKSSAWRLARKMMCGVAVLPMPSWLGVRLLAVVLSIITVCCIQYLPNQTRKLHFNSNNQYLLFADGHRDGTSQATWLDDYSFSRFKCSLSKAEDAWCGWSVLWPSEPDGLLDFSAYHSLRVRLKYVGEAKRLRIYARNYHEAYGDLIASDPNKFQSVTIYTHEFNEVVDIPLSEFVVADWWVTRFNIPRQHVAPDFSAVQMLAIDFPQPGVAGDHVMEVLSIELVGEWVSKESAYLALLVLWLLVLAAEGGYRYYLMNIKVERARARALTLESYARELRTQTSIYKKLSGVDPLTGAYNRAGVKPLLKKSFDNNRRTDHDRGVVMVIDIDHFKRVNDTYGHSVGDAVIKHVAYVITDAIRASDLFARWGGEEFLLICPGVNRTTAAVIGEKLRQAICEKRYDANVPAVTVSLGITLIRHDDTFNQAFDRADQALYQAKRSGRNRVVFFEFDETVA
ncbi:GGDEF domain-containing protein [Marinagarivorans algicola]|uniref:GGDEF domain-containing protein n=1 Tax=Marinagarivorans algicola TaxID=1513270 RepID=UPI0009E8C66B|nr:GGDEF domain-containing protein [Marinagarivorans algicola]